MRGTAHADLWTALSLVMEKLGDDRGCPGLGLPALDAGLWNCAGTSDLDGLPLSNQALLSAVRALAWAGADRLRRPVDYRNLGPEELGSAAAARTRRVALGAARVRQPERRRAVGALRGMAHRGAQAPGPHPILNLSSEHGTGKTTLSEVARRLVDPHTAMLRAEPRVRAT